MWHVFGHCNVLLPLDMLSHICVPNQDVRNLEEQWLKPFGMLGIVTCVVYRSADVNSSATWGVCCILVMHNTVILHCDHESPVRSKKCCCT